MSFEGYYQILCKNGHYETISVYNHQDMYEWRCSSCDSPAVWYNLVDQTNGSWDEENNRIDGYVYLKAIKEFNCVCEKCGNPHFISPAIYEIPKSKGHLIDESSP